MLLTITKIKSSMEKEELNDAMDTEPLDAEVLVIRTPEKPSANLTQPPAIAPKRSRARQHGRIPNPPQYDLASSTDLIEIKQTQPKLQALVGQKPQAVQAPIGLKPPTLLQVPGQKPPSALLQASGLKPPALSQVPGQKLPVLPQAPVQKPPGLPQAPTGQPGHIQFNIKMTEIGQDVKAVMNRDLRTLKILADLKYRWDPHTCFIVIKTNFPVDIKKQMLKVLLENGLVLCNCSINYLIDNENIEIIKYLTTITDLTTWLTRIFFRIIESEKMDLFKKVLELVEFPDQNVLDYAIRQNKLQFIKYSIEEMGIRYNFKIMTKLITTFTNDPNILNYFEKSISVIFNDDFWNQSVMNENLVILEWSLEMFGLNLEKLMNVACDNDKLNCIKWLYQHMEKPTKLKRKDRDEKEDIDGKKKAKKE